MNPETKTGKGSFKKASGRMIRDGVMKTFSVTVAFLTLLSIVGTANAQTNVERRVMNATEVLQQFTKIPEKGIPPSMLKDAYGIAVIPDTMKIGFMFGGRHGKGVLMVKRPDGSWSNPSFIGLTGGSFGWQIGAQATDIILVFRSRKSIDNIARTKLTLGADASIAAGPVGRQTSAATDEIFKAEIFSYSRSRGIFAGVALNGTIITMDTKSNLAFYRNGQGAAKDVLMSSTRQAPPIARELVNVMNTTSEKMLAGSASKNRTASAPAQTSSPPSSGVKTYGVDSPAGAGVNY
jgi:lipid-binding SYLF domain-containing protein